jgi:hypothetical protein
LLSGMAYKKAADTCMLIDHSGLCALCNFIL